MAETPRTDRLDQPREGRGNWFRRPKMFREGAFGVAAEGFARWMGTPQFLVWMTIFVMVWLAWNTFMPESAQFDPRSLNYTLLTLILSLQASYAAPLLLLAQNRQDDRDRVIAEQDRSRDERNLADTEYLTREVAALRFAMRDAVTRDYLRSELRDLLEELRSTDPAASPPQGKQGRNKKKSKASAPSPAGQPAALGNTPSESREEGDPFPDLATPHDRGE